MDRNVTPTDRDACPVSCSRAGIGGVRRECSTLGLADGYETFVLRHAPNGEANGVPVLYVHGIQSHPGWYVGSADALAAAGHEVYQVARRGSGPADRGRGHARDAKQLLGDIDVAVEHVRARSGSDRVALLGVSWAGKLLIPYAAAHPDAVASLMLAAPGLVAQVDIPLATKLAVAACLLCCRRRSFEIPLNDVTLFTDNEAMRKYLRNDTHRLMKASAGLLLATAQLDRMVRRLATGALTAPTTVVLAGRDRIADNGAVRRIIGRATGGKATFVEFDAAHTIEFETDPAEFFDVICRAVAASA